MCEVFLVIFLGQTVTPDPLEELFGNGLDQKVDSWSTNLLFGDTNFNEMTNSLVSTPPPLQRNSRQGNSQRESLPMGLSFLNGGESLRDLFGQDTNPPPIDSTSTSENGLFNIPPMPNFDQLGLDNVLDKFLPIDGSVRLPPPSNDPIVHSRDTVPIPSIGQLGLDSSGLFGQSMFSPNAGSLSSKPTTPSRLADPTPTPRTDIFNNNNHRNNNNRNSLSLTNQMNPTFIPPTSPTTVRTDSTQAPSVSERSEQQKLLDQQIWDSIIPPLPQNRKPVEVFPQNEPTPKPKVNQVNQRTPKKKKALLPLLPPSPSRKPSGQSRSNTEQNTNKNEEQFQITNDNLLNSIPDIDQLIFGTGNDPVATTKSPPNINNQNLIENIPSIDELGFDLLGSTLPLLDKGPPKLPKTTPRPPENVDNTFPFFPDPFGEGNRQTSSTRQEQSASSIQTPANNDVKTDTDNSTTSLETLWNILIETVPGLPGIISGEEVTTPKPKGSFIESVLGISASDIDKFNNETQSQNSLTGGSPVSLLPDVLPTEKSPEVIKPTTTLPPVIYIQTSTTPAPPLTVYTLPPTTQSPTTPKAVAYNPSDFLNMDTVLPSMKPPQPPEPYVPTPTVLTIGFGTKKPDTKSGLSKPRDGGLQTDNTPPPFDFTSLFLPTENNLMPGQTKSKQNADTMIWQPDLPFENPFLFDIPTIPEEELKKPKFEDLGIINNEPDLLPEMPLISTIDQNQFGEKSGTNEQAPQRQSQTFDFELPIGGKQANLFDTLPNIFEEPKLDNNINTMPNELQINTGTNTDLVMDPNSPYKNVATKTEEELSLPGLDSLLGENQFIQKTLPVTTTTPPTTTMAEVPMLDLSLLGGFNTDIMNQEQRSDTANEEHMKINIQHSSLKDVPPLDFDIFKGTVKTTPPPIPTLPPLPSLGNLNTVVDNGQQSFGGGNFEMTNNVDPLKRIIDSGPTIPPNSENSVPISNSLRQNSELFPFVAPTSEASKHFVFQDQLNGGNMRTHPILQPAFTTPKPPVKDGKPSKPNIIVIDIQKRPPERPPQRQTNPLQNTNNIASIETVSNSKNIVTLHQGARQQQINHSNNLQQVTPAPSRVTTPSWLASTIQAIKERLIQLRALRNRQNNGNNNTQNQVSNIAQNQNRNLGQAPNIPSTNNAANNQRSNLQQIQIQLRNRLLQNGNLRNTNNQQRGGNGASPLANLNIRGLPQNQIQQQRNFQLQGRPQFQIPNLQNQFNPANAPQFRQPSNIPSQNQRQISPGNQGSQTQQTDATQNDLELVRERIRQRIQQVLRTQILRHLLARRLQALQNQTPNNAQQPQQPQQPQNQNQPVWRPPSANNNMNVMNANNAINLIRQARQRTLMASQQQRQQQQQQQQQNQPNIDLSRNIFERFPNRNFQNAGFVPNQFRPPQAQQRFDFARLFQNNGRQNLNNRFVQPFQQLISNETNGGNGNNREQQLDLSRPPSELALQNLRNFNLQRARGVQQGTTSNFRTNQNLVVQRRTLPVSEAFQLIERLRAQNRDIAPLRNFNSNNIPNSLVERFRNGLARFQPVQNVPHTVFNRQRIVVPINGPVLGQRNNQNITRRPNLGQTSAPPRFTAPPGGWNWVAQQNSDR